MKVAISLIVFMCVWCSVTAKCVMLGECIEINGFAKPCPVDEDAPPIGRGLSPEDEEDIINIFANRCPSLVYDEEGNRKPNDQIVSCCDAAQLRKMDESLTLAEGVLGRCPTCFRNFVRQICEMNCSPDHSRFVSVVTEVTNDIEYVNEINYNINSQFLDDAHASCAGVLVPQTGLPAINMMCGNAVVCDADAWFGFTGDTTTNPLAPVQVNFLRSEDEATSMSVRAPPCNETLEGEIPCSCVDCNVLCPEGTQPVIPSTCTILSVNCIGFSVAIVFFVISVTIFIILTLFDYKKIRNMVSTPPGSEPPPEINRVIRYFQKLFSKIGGFSASNPALMIMLSSWLGFIMLFGVLNLNLTSNPIELWSGPNTRSRQELNYFNSRFGPFYRAAQVFMTFDGLDSFQVGNVTYGPAFRIEALEELVNLEDKIIDIGRDNGGVLLEDVCYAPLRPRGGEVRLDQCVTMSASVYLNDRDDINNNTYLDMLQGCLNNHYALNCLASWGGGSEPEITFGGYEGEDMLTATTLLINFPISNFLTEAELAPVLEWEQSFLDLMVNYIENDKPDYVTITYGSERSIEDEIRRVSVMEAIPIAISYIFMFIYVVISLGNVRNCKTWFIDSKVMVAVSSIGIVILAIFCAMGVMGYAGITATLLAINVIPFFVLSIGIDNVFLMVNTLHDIQGKLKEYKEYNENLSFDKKRRLLFEKMMERVGPSIFVSSVTQITCFAIGTITNLPAVVTFAAFVSISLGFLFVFQITVVIAILSIDYKRAFQNRFDVLCCIRKKMIDDEDPLNSETPYESLTHRLMRPYTKFLLNWKVKIIVAIIFMLIFSISIVLIPQLEIGLDQELALPPDSYVYKYLQSVNHLMTIGPPVYFVLKSGLNFTDPDHQNVICGGQLCNDDSLFTQVYLASMHTNITFIARSSNSWLDDFIDWSSLPGACCQYNTTDGGFCGSTDTSPECTSCVVTKGEYANGLRPSIEAFERYIPFFLQDEPTEICNKGGLASYSSSVNYVLDAEGRATVYESNFMAYHSSLSTSQDYINAVKYGYEISENITAAIQRNTGLDVEVFPYSVFYVFYEQYLTMWTDTFTSLAYSFLGAFVLNLITSGFSLVTTFAVMFTSLMVVLNMMGIMYIWSIPLNAVSVVNLVVSIGIAVEFCSHIAYAFDISKSPKRDRVADAVQTVGSTIITGITLTNIPIIVLAFSYTEIIEIFFFRMLFSIVILGFLHGMIFFPVLLSFLTNIRS